jgi:hypothetical protein
LIKERYFTTPLAHGSTLKRSLPPPTDPNQLSRRQLKALNSEKGNGKGKGRGRDRGRCDIVKLLCFNQFSGGGS